MSWFNRPYRVLNLNDENYLLLINKKFTFEILKIKGIFDEVFET